MFQIASCAVGIGQRYQILSHVFARCASQKTHGHASFLTRATHIPQATAYCADQQIQISYLSKNRMSAQIQMAFCKCLETIAGMNLSQSQPKFTRNVKNAKTCIGWASIYFWVMDCFSNMPLKITIFCVIEQPWHQHALEKSVPKTSSPLFFWGLDCWWVSSKQCVMLNSF